MDFEPNVYKRKISEMLHTQGNKYTVNKKEIPCFLIAYIQI